ncbi:hypothetical protein CCHR01_10504 [Colletotrichum chrysophilum]|uniref:Uncharacterized protein n=1 Tax=Colletotrichum chrysophilum TaxID=1836956 RepID=A0AAD9EGQ4_9PEZI|nr:hypothetical protein CCHR01_10504 [Colletotrichum chrysophilum]
MLRQVAQTKQMLQISIANSKNSTYNTGHSPVVTDPTTTPALTGLSMGERTGSRVLQWVWSYVVKRGTEDAHIASVEYSRSAFTISPSRQHDPCHI